MTQRDSNWPVTAVCLGSMWLCLLSIAYLPAATHAQPHMRKPPERRRGERRDAGVTRHTAGASRASAHVPARGAPRPAAPRVARLTPCDSVARVSVSIRARSPPGAAGGAARRTALHEARSRSQRSHRARQAAGHARTRTAARTANRASTGRENVMRIYSRGRSAGRPSSPRQRRRRRHVRPGVRSPQPSPLRSRASVRQAPRCRATDVNLDGERLATICLVADARATAPAVPW